MSSQTEMLDNKMRQIQSLLARADHPNTPPEEADSARAMAERIRIKYNIEEAELVASGALAGEQYKPGVKRMPVCPFDNDYMQTYWALARYAAQHTGCRIHYASEYDAEHGTFMLVAVMVGFEMDLRFAESLFVNARIVFADRMEPKYDSNLSDEDNVYKMRSAGLERGRIGVLMGWGGEGTQGPNKVTRVYKRACKARGEDAAMTGRSMNVKLFRETYADGFKTEFWNMLWKARNANVTESAGAVVLANRKEDVDEAFYQMFPNLRPAPEGSREIGEGKSTKAKKLRGPTKAEIEREYKRRYSAAGQAGRAAGSRAARDVEVGGNAPKGRLHD